jgi:sugar lactone lactonase YvrE
VLDRVVGLAAVVPFVVGAATGPALPPATVELSFRDPAIVEGSGLVVTDGLFVTVNDSGDSGRVFVVDRSGATVGVTSWDGAPTDVEALAPAGPGHVWVGDTGDNSASRDSVEVMKVPVGRGDRRVTPERYELVYPGGARDAETLMADPRTGRLFVVSKILFGGTVYAAPRHLSAEHPNRLRRVADSVAFATDGAFFPDGRHYVVRGYGDATVFTFPGHEEVGSFPLPRQQQGEGIAVDADGTVFVSTEGQFSDVLRVRLPRAIQQALAPPSSTPSPSTPSPSSGRATDVVPSEGDDGPPGWPWLLGGAVVVVGFVAGAARILTRRGSAS